MRNGRSTCTHRDYVIYILAYYDLDVPTTLNRLTTSVDSWMEDCHPVLMTYDSDMSAHKLLTWSVDASPAATFLLQSDP